VFDSSTKFPESVLMGQSVFLGNFDECIAVEDVPTKYGPFRGQYCLVAFRERTASTRSTNSQTTPDIGGPRGNILAVAGSDRTVSGVSE
jgi:hypothetical protein